MFGRASFEEQLSTIMENLGPTVALGRRGEVLPTFGFAREYVGDSEWQRVLGDYLSRSSWAVFLLYEITPNLAYEVAIVLDGHSKLRVLFVPPPVDSRTDDWYAKYRILRNSVLRLPEIDVKTAALIFDSSEGIKCIEVGSGSGASAQLSAIRQALIPHYLYD
jgi:enterochelin esterase-like enzyme